MTSRNRAERLAYRCVPPFLLLACIAQLVGCTSVIGHFMTDAPNKGDDSCRTSESCPAILGFHGVDRQFRVAVGPPDASLLVWVIDPVSQGAAKAPPRGTILVLHGYRNEMQWMLGQANEFARHGYRAVLVDLRGQGSSSGESLSYGVREAVDLVQVVDELDRRGDLSTPLGVWGMSYGASTSIMLAAQDPRVSATVAVAPFASMRDIVPHYIDLFSPGANVVMTDADVQQLITQRAESAGFDADRADMTEAARIGRSPLLLIHGDWDVLVPPEHSARIERAAADSGRTVERIIVPATGHVTIWMDVAGRVGRESVAWFDRWLAAQQQSSASQSDSEAR